MRLRPLFLALPLAWASAVRADTVQASSTTLLLARQDFRDGSLLTAVPLYQLLNLDASDVKTPFARFEVALSTWGAVDLADVRFWQNGAPSGDRFTGDVSVGFVRAELLDRRLTLTLGRQMVTDGNARQVQIDGANGRVELPMGFGLSGYVGVPVAPRFAARGGSFGVATVNATLASGGRLFWHRPGLLEIGTSVAWATDRGAPARQDIGFDVRITPLRKLSLTGAAFWSIYAGRLGEAVVAATYSPLRNLDVSADYRRVEPDLFLPLNSILSVFASEKRNDFGGAVHWAALRQLALDADYHVLLEDNGTTGHWAKVKGTYYLHGPATAVGTELSILRNSTASPVIVGNGYQEVRLFGTHRILPNLVGTADFMAYFFDHPVNAETHSISGTATLAYEFARGWRAALAGTAGSTPFLSRQLELMAKLVYEQTYAVREVK